MPRLLAIAAFAAWIALDASRASADVDGEHFVSGPWRVRLTAPNSWQLTEKTAYPSVLLRMVRRAPDGKMLLTAERLVPGLDALAYARRTADLLTRMRFWVGAPQLHSSTGAYLIDAQRPGAFLRQAFLVANGVGYSLTLATVDNRTRSQLLRAFDYVLRSIQILRPEEVPVAPPASDEKPGEQKEATPPAQQQPPPAESGPSSEKR